VSSGKHVWEREPIAAVVRAVSPLPRFFHRVAGVLTVLAFLATGLYMRWREPPVAELDPHLRMLFRSRHIYLLLSGLMNLAIGSYATPLRRHWANDVALAGSVMLAASPILLFGAFALESELFGTPTGISQLGLYALYGGTLLHFVAAIGGGGFDVE